MDNLQKRKLPLFNGSQNFKEYFEELNSIIRILKPIKGFRSEIATIFYASSISNLIMLAPMIYLLQIFDRIMISQSLVSLGSITGLLAFLYLVMIKAEKIRSKLIISFGLKLDEYYSRILYDGSFKQRVRGSRVDPFQYHDDFTLFRQWITGMGINGIFDLPWVPIYLYFMFLMHPVLGISAIIIMTINILFGIFFDKYMGQTPIEISDEERSINQYTYKNLRHQDISSVYNLAEKFKEKWMRGRVDLLRKANEFEQKQQLVMSANKQIRFFLTSSALGIAAMLVIAEELTLGAMIAAAMLMGRCIAPVDSVASGISAWIPIREAVKRINKFLDQEDKKDESIKTVEFVDKPDVKLSGDITFREVSVFDAEGQKELVRDINLIIPDGKITALVGHSGSGKTTILKTILGINNAKKGVVSIGNERIDSDFLKRYRGQIGYVPQEITLMNGMLSKNIARMEEPDPEEVVRVSTVCEIHHMILRLPNGYDSIFTEESNILSGGQIQRVALARALYGDPHLIILDEANSNLDTDGENNLIKVIKDLREKNKTIIFVTHRKQIINIADNVVEIAEGKVSFQGEKDDFLKYFEEKNNR